MHFVPDYGNLIQKVIHLSKLTKREQLPPFELLRDHSSQNSRVNFSKISINQAFPCKKGTGILAGSRRESRFPPRSRQDLASPGIFPPGSRQEKNPAIDPAGTPTGNLCLHRDPAKNPDYAEIPPGSCQPGYFPGYFLHGDLVEEIKYSRRDVLFLPAWTKLRRFRNSDKRSKIVAIETNLSRRE